MKTEKIIWGLIFIFIGSVFLLDNFDVIEFYWSSVWRFWPMIFILIGANMLFSRFGSREAAPWMAALITAATLIFIGYHGSRPSEDGHYSFEFNNNRAKIKHSTNAQKFSEPMSDTIRMARLLIEGGATSYRLEDPTGTLFEASVESRDGNHSLERTTEDSVEVLNFHMRNQKKNWRMDDLENNQTEIRLNANPLWDIKIQMGAGEVDFDLSSYRVRRLEFNGGAASFEARIGTREPVTEVEVEAGVASVSIEVPSQSGCTIKVDSGLSSKDFPGFKKQADGTYKTENYDSAANKININLKGGLSSFEVKKY